MKTKLVLAISTMASVLLFASVSHAAIVTATGSGNWSSTVPDAPWPGGAGPATNDSVVVNTPFNVTVDTNETVENLSGSGTVTMGANVELNIIGANGNDGANGLTNFIATATGNTVNYEGNAYQVNYTTYYNLIWSGYGGPYAGVFATLNDFTMSGTTTGQQQPGPGGITVGHNWNIGPNASWDISCAPASVAGLLNISGTFNIGCGGAILASFNNVTVNSGGTFNLGDTARATISGNLTNNGTVVGTVYATINMTGTGSISGTSVVTVPVLEITGTTILSNSVSSTHSPTLNGTIEFDLATPASVTVAGTIYENDTLTVINSGAAPATGTTYQLFNATGYNFPYSIFSATNLPALPAGLSWVTALNTTGTISVTGTATGGSGSPTLSISTGGGNATLSWNSTAFPGFSVQKNTSGLGSTNWVNMGSGTVSPYVTPLTTNTVFFRLVN